MTNETESAREHVRNALQLLICEPAAPLTSAERTAIIARLRTALPLMVENPTDVPDSLYREVSIDSVMRYRAEAFRVHGKIVDHDYFIDVHKGVVIFRIYVVVTDDEADEDA